MLHRDEQNEDSWLLKVFLTLWDVKWYHHFCYLLWPDAIPLRSVTFWTTLVKIHQLFSVYTPERWCTILGPTRRRSSETSSSHLSRVFLWMCLWKFSDFLIKILFWGFTAKRAQNGPNRGFSTSMKSQRVDFFYFYFAWSYSNIKSWPESWRETFTWNVFWGKILFWGFQAKRAHNGPKMRFFKFYEKLTLRIFWILA